MRIIEDQSKFETWQNASEASIWIKRLDRSGALIDELVAGRKRVHLSPEERRLNQEIAAEEDLDVFQNGMLVPVRLIDSAEDTQELLANPNNITEEDMVALLKKRGTTALADRVAEISNPIALNRLLELARENDATVKQVECIQARLDEVSPSLYAEVSTVAGV